MQNINEVILDKIDRYCQAKAAAEARRTHLGASLIGQECVRKTWYGFRWAKEEKFSGRMLRLFERGHLEEFRFVEYLRGIGLHVQEVDQNGNQFRISDVQGHFGGSCDGFAWFPQKFPGLPLGFDFNKPVLTEFKTSSDKYFNKLVKDGVAVAKPQHKAQMDVYGTKFGLDYALYISVNKNTDALHVEFYKIDTYNGTQMLKRAAGVITLRNPPERISNDSTFWKCRYCNYSQICHSNERMEKNCRSCLYSKAVDGGEWYCEYHKGDVPKDFIPKGCADWVPID